VVRKVIQITKELSVIFLPVGKFGRHVERLTDHRSVVWFFLRTVLLNNTLYNTCKCSVLYNTYKCGTEVQTSSVGLHDAILHFKQSWTRIKFGCSGKIYGMSRGLGPPAPGNAREGLTANGH
jgi:hypothetical protein